MTAADLQTDTMNENPHYVTVTPGKLHEDDWRDPATVKFESR